MLRVGDLNLNVDVRQELEEFDWKNASWKEEKLIASSPFRLDERPSFYCFFENGVWGDSGGIGEYEKGGFISLLSFLRNETEEDVIEYLLEKYGVVEKDGFHLQRIRLPAKSTTHAPLPYSLISSLSTHPYLTTRGIGVGIQKALKTGYSTEKQAIAIPWFLPDGRLGNIKYRRIDSKRFFYEKFGWSISKMLYGIHIFHQKPYLKHAVITEAEIDAMSCMTVGFPALAVGSSSWSHHKTNLILNSNIEEITIATDNDNAGKKLRGQIIEALAGRISIRVTEFPGGYKDCNDLLNENSELLRNTLENAKSIRKFRIKLFSKFS